MEVVVVGGVYWSRCGLLIVFTSPTGAARGPSSWGVSEGPTRSPSTSPLSVTFCHKRVSMTSSVCLYWLLGYREQGPGYSLKVGGELRVHWLRSARRLFD